MFVDASVSCLFWCMGLMYRYAESTFAWAYVRLYVVARVFMHTQESGREWDQVMLSRSWFRHAVWFISRPTQAAASEENEDNVFYKSEQGLCGPATAMAEMQVWPGEFSLSTTAWNRRLFSKRNGKQGAKMHTKQQSRFVRKLHSGSLHRPVVKTTMAIMLFPCPDALWWIICTSTSMRPARTMKNVMYDCRVSVAQKATQAYITSSWAWPSGFLRLVMKCLPQNCKYQKIICS